MKFYDHTKNIPHPQTNKTQQSHSGNITYSSGKSPQSQTLYEFNNRIQAAIRQKSKSFTMTIEEANLLFLEINKLIIAQKDMQDNVFALKSQIIEERQKQMEEIVVAFDGGSLKRD